MLSINGATFAGAEWIDTNFNPASDGSLLDNFLHGAFILSNPTSGSNEFLFGGRGAGRTELQQGTSRIDLRVNSAVGVFSGTEYPLPSSSLILQVRENNTQVKMVTNGVPTAPKVLASTAISDDNQFVGAISSGGVAANFWEGTISTFIIGAAIGFDQAAHNTNHSKLLTDLGVTLP